MPRFSQSSLNFAATAESRRMKKITTELNQTLDVLNFNRVNPIMKTDNDRKTVSFNGKIGINQQSDEVNGLLDIDNLTQETILDLFNTFSAYSTNSTDIIRVIQQLPIQTNPMNINNAIKQLFSQGNSLFDYKNQCGVFSVPIGHSISKSDVSIIHNDELGTVSSLITNDSSITRVQTLVKEIEQMIPEVTKANDNSFTFSFIELLFLDNKSFMTSLKATIDINTGMLIFVITFLDVFNIVENVSIKTPFLNTMDYVSREMRFINYASLLFNDHEIIDNQGNYTVDSNDNINFQTAIKNNQYFSNRWELLPESYLFSMNLSKDDVYIIMEGSLHWCNKLPIDCWSDDNNVQIVIDLIKQQNHILYNDAHNSVCPVNYRWRGGRKLSFTNTMNIKGNEIMIGSGFDLNSIIKQSLLIKGDNTISGNFFVNDSNNNNIFKVDNVNHTITNTYKVGIGVDEPKSILDIKDTTITDILYEKTECIQQYNILNKIAKRLCDIGNNPSTPFNSSTDFASIINDVYVELSIPQTIQNYGSLWELDMTSMLPNDVVCCSHWMYPHWNKQKVGDIQDTVNQFSLTTLKTTLLNMFNNALIYDKGLYIYYFTYVFGKKVVRILFLEINGKMYELAIGTNLQHFNLRPDSNTNITGYITNCIRANSMTNRICAFMKGITPINNVENLNELRVLNRQNSDILLSNFILTINMNDIFDTKYQEVHMDSDNLTTNQEVTMSNVVELKDLNINTVTKYKNFWVVLMNKKYYDNMLIDDFNVICYEDLQYHYKAGIKCLNKDGNTITLLCNENRIESVINPSLSVEGDAKITGDLLITSRKDDNNKNYVSIDPDNEYMGIGTDKRFINYSDMAYSTTDNVYAGRHNLSVLRESYPVMVSDRIQEKAVKIDSDIAIGDVPTGEMSYFSTYSAYTAKRTSKIYTFNEIVSYADEYNSRVVHSSDKVTHLRYGPDIAFEVRDTNDRTVEIGQIQMVIDRTDSNNRLRGGFGVQVHDPASDETSTVGTSRRNLLYVDNDSQLFVQKVNLNGGVLTTDDGTNLFWNGKKVLTE